MLRDSLRDGFMEPEPRAGDGDRKRRRMVRIQRCLNQLGYSVGVADGTPGRRTRRAIQMFQQDQGLTQASRREVTQRLRSLCQGGRPRMRQQRSRDRRRIPEYPQAMCASRGLYNLILGRSGSAGLQLCSEACAPARPRFRRRGFAPDGPASQCSNCIQIGNLGYVCSR